MVLYPLLCSALLSRFLEETADDAGDAVWIVFWQQRSDMNTNHGGSSEIPSSYDCIIIVPVSLKMEDEW